MSRIHFWDLVDPKHIADNNDHNDEKPKIPPKNNLRHTSLNTVNILPFLIHMATISHT